MAEDSTRQLLKLFGVAVTGLEDAVEAGTGRCRPQRQKPICTAASRS